MLVSHSPNFENERGVLAGSGLKYSVPLRVEIEGMNSRGLEAERRVNYDTTVTVGFEHDITHFAMRMAQ